MRLTHRSIESFWQCIRWVKEHPNKLAALVTNEGVFEFRFIKKIGSEDEVDSQQSAKLR